MTGFEDTVIESAAQGRDNSFTLNLTASSPDNNGRMKPGAVIFTKRLSINDLASPTYKHKAGGEDTTDEPIAITLPPMATEVSVSVMGDQSGSLASETIEIDTAATGTSTLFLNVDTLPSELAAYTTESPVDVSLFTAVETGSTGSTTQQKATDPDDQSDSAFLSFTIDPNDGALIPAVKIQSGSGGVGSIGSFDEGGGLGFVVQKSKEEGSDLSAFLRANDGTMKPLALPASSDQTTLAYDTTTKILYMLKPKENRLLVQQQNEDGSLKTLQELTTGNAPAMIYLARVARLAMVVNKQDQTISVFSIAESGSLSELQTITMQQNPTAIEMDPTGRFFYIALENGGISRFTMGEESRLIFTDTIATGVGLVGLKIGETGQVLVGVPKILEKVCPPGEKCKSWRRAFKKLAAVIVKVAKIVVSIVRVVMCPIGGPISSWFYGNPLCVVSPVTWNWHWYRELLRDEVRIDVGDNVTDRWRPYLDNAIAQWSQSSKLNLRKVAGSSNPKDCHPRLGRIEVCNYNYRGRLTGFDGESADALASPFGTNEHLIFAVVQLDDSKIDGTDDAEMRHIMCQELGHALGLLSHRDEDPTNLNRGTCMDYTNDPAGNGVVRVRGVVTTTANLGPLNNLSPDSGDFDKLSRIYGHVDGIFNIDARILKIVPIKLPFNPGVLLASSADRGVRRYEIDYGNGMKLRRYALSRPKNRKYR